MNTEQLCTPRLNIFNTILRSSPRNEWSKEELLRRGAGHSIGQTDDIPRLHSYKRLDLFILSHIEYLHAEWQLV